MAQQTWHRPMGVTLLAIGAFIAAAFQLYRMLIFLGFVPFNIIGKEVSYPNPQWGMAFWALILAAIWIWVGQGFWNVRGYAWTFGVFISLFTVIWGFFAVLFGSSVEAETVPWLLAGLIYLYLNYPGVRQHFMEHEMSMLTPEQRAAMDNLAAANAAAAQAMAQPAAPAAAPAAPAAAPAAPPPAPPSDMGQPPSA